MVPFLRVVIPSSASIGMVMLIIGRQQSVMIGLCNIEPRARYRRRLTRADPPYPCRCIVSRLASMASGQDIHLTLIMHRRQAPPARIHRMAGTPARGLRRRVNGRMIMVGIMVPRPATAGCLKRSPSAVAPTLPVGRCHLVRLLAPVPTRRLVFVPLRPRPRLARIRLAIRSSSRTRPSRRLTAPNLA